MTTGITIGRWLHRAICCLLLLVLYGCASTDLKRIPDPLQSTEPFESILLEYVRGNDEYALRRLKDFRKQHPEDQRGQILHNALTSETEAAEKSTNAVRKGYVSFHKNNSRTSHINLLRLLSGIQARNPTIQKTAA